MSKLPCRDEIRSNARRVAVAGGVAAVAAALCLVAAQPASAATTTVSTADTLKTAMADATNDTVVLGADITVNDGSNVQVSTSLAKTLDLNGHALTVTSVNANLAAVQTTGASLTVEDTGGGAGTLNASGGTNGAGVGGGNGQSAGSLTVISGSVLATGGNDAAGVGGGSGGNGGSVTIGSSGYVHATGGSNGAGVGGGKNGSGGTVQTSGPANPTANVLDATGGSAGAGIGGGLSGSGGTFTMNGGGVNGHGGTNAAGVGGGDGGGGASVTVTAGTLFAIGGTNAAGAGGGRNGAGGSLTIGASGSVTAYDGGSTSSAVGQGAGSSTFGSLDNAGGLVVDTSSTLRIPSGATVHNTNTIYNKGTITAGASSAGTLQNDGTIFNTGTVQNAGDGGSGNVTVSNHNYRLDFDVNGGPSATPPSARVYASTALTANVSFPTVSPPTGGTFLGWYTAASGGTQVTTSTDLSSLLPSGPSHATLYAHYRLPQTITFPIIGDQTFGAPDFALTATASSGLPVSYSAGPSSVCTVSGSTLHLVAAGSCTVFASQDGNAQYLPASAVARSFNVQTGTVTVTATGSQTFGGLPTFVPTGSLPAGVSLSGTLSCTGLTGGVTIKSTLAPNAYTINSASCGGISLTGPNAGSYHMAYGNGTFTVSPATVVVTATGSQEYQGVAHFKPVVTLPPNVGLAGTLSCARLTGSTPIDANLAVGSYTVDSTTCSGLSLGGTQAYGYQLAYANGAYTVAPKSIVVTATGTQGFGATPTFTPQATVPTGVTLSGTLTCTKLTGNIPISSSLSVSNYTIDGTSCSGLSLTGAQASNYQIAYANGPFTVTKAHISIATHTNSTANALSTHSYVFTSTVTNSDAHTPIANVKVTITVKLGLTTVTCSSLTNASGVATCSSGNGNLFLNAGHAYTATTAATANYFAGSGSGNLGS